MPWLLGTAFLHSIMVQERRGMLRIWNVSLIVATFTLCLLGTFLVRSGILESIHAFGVSKVGGPLLALIAVVVLGSAALIVTRLDDLRSERRIDSLVSRESVFLVNNLLLVGLCAVIFWGTFFPLISEALTGEERSVGPPFFNAVDDAAGDRARPVHRDRAAARRGAGSAPGASWRLLGRPAAVALVVAGRLVAFSRRASTSPRRWCCSPSRRSRFAALGAGVRCAAAVGAAGARGGGSRLAALVASSARNRRRYGGYIVHAGIAVLFVAVAASSSFQTSATCASSPGESAEVGDYTVTYERPTACDRSSAEQRLTFGAVLDVDRDGENVRRRCSPSRNYYSRRRRRPADRCGASSRARRRARSAAAARPGGDLWTAMQPDLEPFDPAIRQGGPADRRALAARPADRATRGPGGVRRRLRAQAICGLRGATWPTRRRPTSGSTSTRS